MASYTAFKRFSIFAALLAIPPSVAASRGLSVPTGHPSVSEADILSRLEFDLTSRLSRMGPNHRGHVALRFYRISGDARYVADAKAYYAVLRKYFRRYVRIAGNEERAEKKSQRLILSIPPGEKRAERAMVLGKYPDFEFVKRVLYVAYQAENLGMSDGPDAQVLSELKDYLKKRPFDAMLADPDVLSRHAADAVNMVYYLKDLGIADVEREFTARFKTVFMAADDAELSPLEYREKIYGLTHFVIAGSDYYQRFVPAEKYAWVLDYFAKHASRVIARAKPDAIAEVGLCFKLAGLKDHPVVARTRSEVARFYDPKRGIIATPWSKNDRNTAQHRDTVAYLLFKDFDRLYPGPDLSQLP
jgi:hypothetical protein